MSRSTLPFLILLIVLTHSKLYQVVSQFRHGARYPVNSYYDGNETKELRGELSAVGMRQHQTFGKMLRKDYIDGLGFLSKDYKEGQLEVYSTSSNRTITSVLSQLYGLYPLGQGAKMPKVTENYHFPPYSYSNDSQETAYSLPEGHRTIPVYINQNIDLTKCGKENQEVDKNIQAQRQLYDQMHKIYGPFLQKIGSMFNITNMTIPVASSLFGTLTADIYLGRPLPKDFTKQDQANIRHLHYWYDYFKLSHNLSKAINTGKIVKILQDFDDRIKNPFNKTLKWTIISAHDTDAACMMNDLNISSASCVQELYTTGKSTELNCSPDLEYVTNLIFELHSDDGKNFEVKIRHDGEYVYLCERKQISCPYEEWKRRVKNIIVDVESICGPLVPEMIENDL